MNKSGKVERYDAATGRHEGTFISGIRNPNGITWGPDGDLYISGGAIGGPGSVKRFDGKSGRFLGDFVACPHGSPGYLARGTGLVFHDGDLYVGSCDDGRIVRYDGSTGAWKSDFATVPVNGVTQIEFHDGMLYIADFADCAVRKCDGRTGAFLGNAVDLPGSYPWGIVFDAAGNLFWSGSANTIRRFDGKTDGVWAGAIPDLKIPLRLAIGPDGNLYCSYYGSDAVGVWKLDQQRPDKPLRIIRGPEVQGPAGLAFTTEAMPQREPMKVLESRRGGSVRLEADPYAAQLPFLGWDTEGGDRARLNLLLAPAELRALPERRRHQAPVRLEDAGDGAIRYRLHPQPGTEIAWEIRESGGGLRMQIAGKGSRLERLKSLELALPFDPCLCATTVITGDWTPEGKACLPFIISAPDIGPMLVTCPQHPRLAARVEGSRAEQWVTVTVELPVPREGEPYTLEFSPVRLPAPEGLGTDHRWLQARRGWFDFLQLSANRATEGGLGALAAGVWANNVISDPVSSTVFWLGDHVILVPELAPGVSVAPILRRTVEFWMDNRVLPGGDIAYVGGGSGGMMDSNPAILIGAWAYVEATGDTQWLARRIDKLERISDFDERRDIDGDGLVESPNSGNRGARDGSDTAWDTYTSGHKNAYVNLLVYRAWRGLAQLEGRLGRSDRQAHYSRLADRLKSAFLPAFYDPQTGWLGWWRSRDGFLHDIYSDVPTSLAVMYGLVDRDSGKQMLDRYWAELQKSGFSHFDLGVPLNIRPVPRDDQLGDWGGKKEDGSDMFGKYLNGGCCVSNASLFLIANYVVGNTQRADAILNAMLSRQEKGVYPNGGGFQNGIVNRYPDGAEFFDWQGNTCGYEGHLVYSWCFLQAVLLRHSEYRDRLFGVLSKP